MKKLSKTKLKTLIVASYPQELAKLVTLGKKHFCVKNDIGFLSAGIGLVASTFGLTHCLKQYQPQMILALGTAGILDVNNFNIGDLVAVKSVSIDSAEANSYLPKIMQKSISCNQGEFFQSKILKSAQVYSSLGITKTESWRQHLVRQKYQVENLEAYSYFFVAQMFKIPVQMIMGLTNTCGPNSHNEWLENEKACCKQMASYVQKILQGVC